MKNNEFKRMIQEQEKLVKAQKEAEIQQQRVQRLIEKEQKKAEKPKGRRRK
jgi:hypothetical protein